MSWLFGRRNEEDDDDDDYTEEDEDEVLTSEGEEEEDEEEEDEVAEEEDHGFELVKEAEQPATPDPVPLEDEEDPAKPEETNDEHPVVPDNGNNEAEQSSTEVTDAEKPEVPDEPPKNGNNGTSEATGDGQSGKEPSVEDNGELPDGETIAAPAAPIEDDKTSEAEKEEDSTEDVRAITPEPSPKTEATEEPVEEMLAEGVNQQAEETTETSLINDATKEETHDKDDDVKEGVTTDSTQSAPGEAVSNETTEESVETVDKPDKPSEEVEEVTSTHEKRSLLVLAAEHDRVDILKAILADDSEDRDTLLNSSIPPLHISITYGSTNAVQCLLRMGADPSVRPDVQKIKADAGDEEDLVDIPNMGRFDHLSAWELAFGKEDDNGKTDSAKKNSGGWFGGGGDKKSSIDIAPSKLEGIRHAFTAEALRCIGSDEAHRLKQLLDSGMPCTIDIGGKNLYDWSVEMGALQCEELLRPAEADRNKNSTSENDANNEQQETNKENAQEAGSTAVLDRSTPGTESLSQLTNRIDELESLSKALSSCLDNLAEEVSVCHGLLLMGGGATALASHVRSLKALKENKTAELERFEEAWENSEDELAYWAKECGEEGKEIAELMSTAIISSAEKEMNASFRGWSPEDEQAHKQQLKAQAAALENKIRKLRASIADLSEESTRDLEEVERRGLSGGIKLVRTLREELREVEFTLNETKSAEALCRAKIKVIQSKVSSKQQTTNNVVLEEPAVATDDEPRKEMNDDIAKAPVESADTTAEESKGAEAPTKPANGDAQQQSTPVVYQTKSKTPPVSDDVSTGQSSAVALKTPKSHGYFTVDLWEILLRIIGLGSSSRTTASSQNSASNVMIV